MTMVGNITRTCSCELENFQEKIWSILLLQIVLAVAGNAYAMYRFLAQHKWNTGNVYSFNLAISDLLYASSLFPLPSGYLLSPPEELEFRSYVLQIGPFFLLLQPLWQHLFCRLYQPDSLRRCCPSFFAHGHMKLLHAKLLSGAVWLLVTTISAPALRFSMLNTVVTNASKTIQCLGSAPYEQLPKYWPYCLFLLGFGFGVPFILTSVSCGGIIYKVHHNCNLTNVKKRRVKTLVSAMVILYIIFYLPFHALQNLYLSHRMQKKENCNGLISNFFQVAKILVHFHICIHPLLYAAQVNSMHEYCCRGFRWCQGVRGKKNVELRM